jgi:hypothetical protein
MFSQLIITLINWCGVFILVNTIFDRLNGLQIQYKTNDKNI